MGLSFKFQEEQLPIASQQLLLLGLLMAGLTLAFGPVSGPLADPTTWTDQGIISTVGGDAYYPSAIYDANCFGAAPCDPTTVKYKMWYSDGSGNAFLVESADGLAWTWGAPTALVGVTAPHHVQVLYDAACFGAAPCNVTTPKYKIWYWDTTSPAAGTIYGICALRTANSADGITWTGDTALTQSGTPLVTGTSCPGEPGGTGTGWNRGTYGPQSLFYQTGAGITNSGTEPFDYSYVMYYNGTSGGTEFTGLAYSADGLDWTAYDTAPVLGGSATAAWDCSDATYGTIMRDGSGFHFWYSGGGTDDGAGNCQDQPSNQGIGYAFSADGKTWTKDAGNPIFHITDGIGYRDGRVYTPSVIDDGSGALKMYYTGRAASGGLKRIGLATELAPPPKNKKRGKGGDDTPVVSKPAFTDEDYIIKRVDLSLAEAGDRLTYTIVFTNPKDTALTKVVVEDELNSLLNNIEASSSRGTVRVEGSKVIVDGFELAPSNQVTVVIRATISEQATPGTEIRNTATLTSPDASTHTSNTVITTILGGVLPDLGAKRGRQQLDVLASALVLGGLSLLLARRLFRHPRKTSG